MRVAVLDLHGNILFKHREATHVSNGRVKVVARLIELIRDMLSRSRAEGRRIRAIGIGAPGVIYVEKGIVVKSPNFPDWNDFGLKQEIESALNIPVFIENDANAAALGEQWLGAGRGARSMILITLGTGVGGGIVLDGKIWHGADGMAGEIGHITIIPEGRRCSCGNRGCLEMYASARGIVQSYREGLDKASAPSDDPRRAYTSEEIFRAAKDGDGLAIHIMKDMGRYLGIGVASLINIFNPEMIVIGGGVMDAWSLFSSTLGLEVRQRAFEVPAKRAAILPAGLGADAGIVGAAAAALRWIEAGSAV